MTASDKGSAGTPASFAQELGAPLDFVLQALRDFGYEEVQEDTSFPAGDTQVLLHALRRQFARKQQDPDGEKGQRADAAFEKHGDALMKLPGVVGTWVEFNTQLGTYTIVVAVNRAPESIKGLPSEVDGVPVTPNNTGTIKAR